MIMLITAAIVPLLPSLVVRPTCIRLIPKNLNPAPLNPEPLKTLN